MTFSSWTVLTLSNKLGCETVYYNKLYYNCVLQQVICFDGTISYLYPYKGDKFIGVRVASEIH